MEAFGERLERLLEERGVTPRALSREIGVASSTLFGWLGPAGSIPRKLDQLEALCRFLRVTADDLLFGGDPVGEADLSGQFKTRDETGIFAVWFSRGAKGSARK